ncbi:hypothetical protein AKJ09_09225 [Labilithrix luteola]|uniref:Secreted protein n=1 Tax=Labilithrix luteola TaxID=1391654 RepID=A0A0K1QA64_9BACT|nr:hypothetical protein [Labilithrix luteola]AKV02562.1 hypothetical protein AKJ09_09225 [Labilithrix luteola]
MKLEMMFGSLAVLLSLVGCTAAEDESEPVVEPNDTHTNPLAAFNSQPEPPGVVRFNPQPDPPGIVAPPPDPADDTKSSSTRVDA